MLSVVCASLLFVIVFVSAEPALMAKPMRPWSEERSSIYLQWLGEDQKPQIKLETGTPPFFWIPEKAFVVPRLGFAYRGDRYEADRVRSDLGLHDLQLGLTSINRLHPDWTFVMIPTVSFRSNTYGALLESNSLQTSVLGVLSWKFRPKMELGFGAIVLKDFYRTRVLPAASFIWKDEEAGWLVRLSYPQTKLQYRLSPEWELKLAAGVEGGHYRLSQGSQLRQSFDLQSIEFRRVLVTPELLWNMHSVLWLHLGVSAVVHERVRAYRLNEQKEAGTGAKNLLLLQAGLGARF